MEYHLINFKNSIMKIISTIEKAIIAIQKRGLLVDFCNGVRAGRKLIILPLMIESTISHNKNKIPAPTIQTLSNIILLILQIGHI